MRTVHLRSRERTQQYMPAKAQCGGWQSTPPPPGRSWCLELWGAAEKAASRVCCLTLFLEPLTLFSADWFRCVASKMVMNCRYWGLVQRPMPGRERTGSSIRKTRKEDVLVLGRELEMEQEGPGRKSKRKRNWGPTMWGNRPSSTSSNWLRNSSTP